MCRSNIDRLSREPRLTMSSRCIALLFAVALLCCGCWQGMADQPKLEPLEVSDFFADGRASRQIPEGTVARGHLHIDHHLYTGKINGNLVDTFPDSVNLSLELLERGQQRFDIFCAPCHDRVGNGQGMVVQRGFPAPPSLHSERLRNAAVGHYFDVITNGFGRMPDYREQITPADRWAIVAHIRALQLSQNAPRDRLAPVDLEQLQLKSQSQGTASAEQTEQPDE